MSLRARRARRPAPGPGQDPDPDPGLGRAARRLSYLLTVTATGADGRKEKVLFDKITSRVAKLAYGLNQEYVDPVRPHFLDCPFCTRPAFIRGRSDRGVAKAVLLRACLVCIASLYCERVVLPLPFGGSLWVE